MGIIAACKNLNIEQIKEALANGDDATVSWSEKVKRGSTSTRETYNLIAVVLEFADVRYDLPYHELTTNICGLLLKHGASLEFKYVYEFSTCWATLTPLMMTVSSACTYIKRRKPELVPARLDLFRTLIKWGANVNAQVENIMKPQKGHDDSAIVYKSGLYLAFSHHAPQVASELILSGEDVNVAFHDYTWPDTRFLCPFQQAVETNMPVEILHLLLACGAESDKATYWRNSPNSLLNCPLEYSPQFKRILAPTLQAQIETLLLCFLRLNLPLASYKHPGTVIILNDIIQQYVRSRVLDWQKP